MSKNLKQMLRITGPALAALILIAVVVSGCKKESNCPDGYDYTIKNNPPKAALAKSDHCEDERIAYNTAVEDSIGGAQAVIDGRQALFESDIGAFFNNAYSYYSQLNNMNNMIDTAKCIMQAIEALWEDYGNPLPKCQELVEEVYNDCEEFIEKCRILVIRREELEECENDVGIDEWIWVEDECGGYWTSSKSGKAEVGVSKWQQQQKFVLLHP